MIKRYKRKNSGCMRRTSRVYLNSLNKSKTEQLRSFCHLYADAVRYFVVVFWSKSDLSSKLAGKDITDKAVKRFGITARVAQLAAKQAKEMVVSQHKKSNRKQRMPRFKNITVTLDSRFFHLSEFDGSFDWALKLQSGFPKIVVPFNNTKHTLKFIDDSWILGNSIRLGIRGDRLFVDLIFEKPRPEIKKDGTVLGVDLGYRVPIATSRKELIGQELKQKIEKSGKRRKTYHHYIETETNRIVKQLSLDDVRVLVLENLKNVKKGKRGKFSRRVNRLLSFWLYAKVTNRLEQICEEQGVCIELKSPWKTSQRCPVCGNIDKRNRKSEKFKCVSCGFEEHADIVGAMNLKHLGLAEVYSLRSLQS